MNPLTQTTGAEAQAVTLLVFHVGSYRLGINLAKVREISALLPIKAVPNSHPVIPGLFELRGRLIPAISLRLWLDQPKQYPATPKIIVAEFLALHTGFMVDSVEGILRLQWSDIEPPQRLQHYSREVLGIVKDPHSNSLITMIDYENIVLTVNPEVFLPHTQNSKSSKRLMEKRKTKSVWVIDDSRTIRDFLKHLLKEQNYSNIVFFENGKHALETLLTLKKAKKVQAEADETHRVDIIITDIEMPVMDAYTFIKTIKEDEVLRGIPVILFSSLIAAGNKLKGELVQADAQLSKSDSSSLVALMDRLVFR